MQKHARKNITKQNAKTIQQKMQEIIKNRVQIWKYANFVLLEENYWTG